jgi:hypothetical protein
MRSIATNVLLAAVGALPVSEVQGIFQDIAQPPLPGTNPSGRLHVQQNYSNKSI